ncbi:MAG: tRNA lysidine(34) synthetase TilS [Silvanigrellales bacterium]|nr:tRNA lysidine(34) synthetase TilS [Silvanigrellales bacterium]
MRLSPLEFAIGQFLQNTLREPGTQAHAALVVLVSGGLDSMTLLRVLAAATRSHRGWKGDEPPAMVALHCNHGTRPDSNADDEETVATACLEWGIELHLARAPFFPAGNFQSAARQWRYAEAERVRAELQASTGRRGYIVTAHHARDVVETMLLHLVRGCGPEGLTGLAPFDPARGLLRPFASVPHAEIQDYAKAQRVPWREDPSNAETHYARNHLRHSVLPSLMKLNPAYERAFTRCAQRIRELVDTSADAPISMLTKKASACAPLDEEMHECFVPLSNQEQSASTMARACRRALSASGSDSRPHVPPAGASIFASLSRALGDEHWKNLAIHVTKARMASKNSHPASISQQSVLPIVVPLPLGASALCFAAGISFRARRLPGA